MTKKEIQILRQASKILHKEWDKTKCPDRNPFCFQCLADRVISDYDEIIDLMIKE